MAFIDQYNLAKDPDFIKRVEVCIAKSAVAVQSEDAGTPNHTVRSQLAFKVLHDTPGYAALFAVAIVSGGIVTTDKHPDNDIEFTVNSLWNAFAVGG